MLLVIVPLREMKRIDRPDRLPQRLQWGVFAALATIFVLMPFHAFLSTWAGSVFGGIEIWKSWKELLLVITPLPLVVWLSLKPHRWRVLFRDPLAWWIVGFVIVLVYMSAVNVGNNGMSATLAGLAMTGRYLVAFVAAYTLFVFGEWRWPDVRRNIARYLVAVGLFVSVLGILQVHVLPAEFLTHFGYSNGVTIAPYTLIDDNPTALRAFATLRGPNDFGAFLILPLLLTLIAARRQPWWLVASAVIGVALFESSSRSAWVGAVVAVVALLAMTYGRQIVTSRRWQMGIAGATALTMLVGIAAVSVPSVRLEIFHSSPGDASLTEGSTDAHWLATSGGIQRVLVNPLGCGAGCAGPASYYGEHARISENYYVQIAEEVGTSGLILWIGTVVIVAQRLWQQRRDYLARSLLAALAGISVIGLWLHVWSDDPLSLTWWMVAGCVLGYYTGIGYDNHEHNQPKTKNDRHTKKASD